MFTGTLIDELLAAIESAEKINKKPPQPASSLQNSLCQGSLKDGSLKQSPAAPLSCSPKDL
jgi:hypothetical protein